MADQNVGIGKAVDLGNLTLRNGDAGLSSNYTLVGGTQQVRVNAAALTITAGSISKTYDGTLAAEGTGSVTSGNLFGTDSLSSTGLSFTDKNVGNHNKTVTANGVSVLDGNGGANYKVTYVSNTNSSIDPKALIVSAVAAAKVYDGKTTASVVLSDDRVAGDILSLSLKPSLTGSTTSGTFISITDASGATTQIVSGSSGANFADKNVAADKTVFVVGIQVTGKDAGNYSSNTSTFSSASITPKELTVVATGKNKVYDGTLTDLVALSSSGVIKGDNLLLTGSGAFADTAAGVAKAVNVTGITAAGGDAGNYSLISNSASTSASITPKIITVLASGNDKVYDGSSSAVVNLSSAGVLFQDIPNVQFDAAAVFANKSAGVGKAVTVSNITASGSQAGNYQINSTAKASASISAKTILVEAIGIDKVYDGSNKDLVSLSSSDLVSGDLVNFASASAVFSDKNVGTGKAVTVSGITLSGTDARNYLANTSASSSASITPKALTVLAVGTNKVYDGSVTDLVSLSSNGVIKGDSLLLAGSGAFADANAGTLKTVNVTGIAASGADAGNYSLISNSASASASITPKIITVLAIGTDKVYDGSTSDVVTLSSAGLLLQDVPNVLFNGAAAFSNKNVGVGKSVAVTNISASGSQSGNYQLKSTTATAYATVTAKAIVVAATGIDKVYDGSTNDLVMLSSNGLVSGDTVSFASASALFGDKNAGIDKLVTVSGITLSGKDAGNYSYNSAALSSADITPKIIAVTATGGSMVYNAKLNAPVTLASNGVLKTDRLSFTAVNALMDNKNVGIAKLVTVSGISALGVDAGNYLLSNSTAMTTAKVTPLRITVIAAGIDKVYDGLTSAPVNLQSLGVIAGDILGFTASSANFANSVIGVNKAVTLSGVSALGADAGNYSVINKTVTTSATIKPKLN